MKITFKRIDDFTWEAEAMGNTAKIKHEYFGLRDFYELYVNDVKIWSYDKLNEARRAGKEKLEKKAHLNERKFYKVEAEVDCEWVSETIEAKYPQEAIDKFKMKYGEIHITSGHNFITKEIVK